MQLKPDIKGSLGYFSILLAVVPLDQLTKWWIRTNFYLGESRPPDGFFRLSYIQNTGASFGIFPDGALFFTIFSTLSFVIMVSIMLFFRPFLPPLDTRLGKLALALVSAGTLGNLIDRYSLGFVVDFINFSFWPAFNVADSAIVVGAMLLGLVIILDYKRDEASNGGPV